MEISQECGDSQLFQPIPSSNRVLPVKATLVCLILACISLPIYKGAMRLPATDRHLFLIVLTMFLAGAAIAWAELREWWKTRTERYGEPPLANLLKLIPSPDKLRARFRSSAQSLNQSTEG
jgi:hypothetical protein